MKVEFRKDIRNQYMVINPADEKDASENYRFNMIVRNRINMFAECSSECINGEDLLYYNVTGKIQLSSYLNTYLAGAVFFETLFLAMADALENIQEFLLEPGGILLDPEYIFWDDGKMYFIYYPFCSRDFAENCRNLSEKLLGSIKQDDIRAVKFGYGFYKYCSLGRITADFLREMAHEKTSDNIADASRYEAADRSGVTDNEKVSEDHSFLFPQKEMAEEKAKNRRFLNKVFKVKEKSGKYPAPPNRSQDKYEIEQNRQFRACLIPEKGFPEKEILLFKERYVVGRKVAGADIALESKAVSRAHAKLIWNHGIYSIVDLSSRNGTRVNGVRLSDGEKFSLKDGDRIVFADASCVYRQFN